MIGVVRVLTTPLLILYVQVLLYDNLVNKEETCVDAAVRLIAYVARLGAALPAEALERG